MPAPLLALYELDPTVTRTQLLDGLAGIPARLDELLRGAGRRALEASPAPHEWPAFRVLCHMRDAALVYSIRFRWMVFDPDPFHPNYDEDSWAAHAADTIDDLPELLHEFAASRSDLTRMLTRLSPEAWGRGGRHEVAGPVVLEPYVRHQLRHEQIHLDQLRAALDKAAATPE